MTRNASTGIYTRVDNSFSNPVTGTTIDPADADTFFDDVESCMNSFIGTSTTSLTIGTGTKAFTTQTTKTFLTGTFVQAISQANSANYMYGTVTSYNSGTGVLTLDVVTTGGSGTLADWLLVMAGARGGTGSTGATGFTSGIRQAYSSTTADADPGAGSFRLNNATPASATAAYLDNADSGGATVSGIFDLFDDSTTTTKGFIRFEKSGDPTVWAQFAVTGSVVDGTGYRKLTLTSGAGSGAFTNADVFAITFYRSGDKGADGAGTGDFSSNTASSVDGEMVLFSGTGGKTGKRSTLNGGLLKSTSGVPSIATPGTDYQAADAQLFSNIPQNAQSAAYTLVATDAQKHILHNFADNNPRTFTIPANATVAFPVGTAVTFVNLINTVTIAITTDQLVLAGAGTTGSRTLAANGIATAIKIASTTWMISGTGLT